MQKIITSLSIVAIVAGLALGVTGAYFSDVETSTGNTFTAGTLDMALSDWSASILSSGPGSQASANGGASFTFGDVAPGDEVKAVITLDNSGGTIGAESVLLDVSASNSDNTCVEPENHVFGGTNGCNIYDMKDHIFVTGMSYGSVTYTYDEIKALIDNGLFTGGSEGGTALTLGELETWTTNNKLDITDIDSTDRDLPAGGTKKFDIKLKFDPDAGNEYQTDSSDITFDFTATQNEQ